MKILNTYYNEKVAGEVEFFFDGDFVITAINGNDAQYRDEYMSCLFAHFDIKVVPLKKLSKEQKKFIKMYCEENY